MCLPGRGDTLYRLEIPPVWSSGLLPRHGLDLSKSAPTTGTQGPTRGERHSADGRLSSVGLGLVNATLVARIFADLIHPLPALAQTVALHSRSLSWAIFFPLG